MNCPSVMLTTIDNPYNPFTQFEEWEEYDHRNGYNSLERLMRECVIASTLTDKEQEEEFERAVDTILKYEPNPIYIRVREDSRIIPIPIDYEENRS